MNPRQDELMEWDLYRAFNDAGELEKLCFLEWVYHNRKQLYEKATYPESLRRFMDPKLKRPSK